MATHTVCWPAGMAAGGDSGSVTMCAAVSSTRNTDVELPATSDSTPVALV